MNDFLHYLLYLLRSSLLPAALAAGACTLALISAFLFHRAKYKGERRFPWAKAVSAVLLTGYLCAVLYVTVWRGDGYGWNLRLFRAWREAWNTFSLKSWLNVLLNVILFLPLGVLLPVIWERLRKWYWTLISGFGFSLCIETAQYVWHRGMFDVDDIFTNTLGAMLGYCVVMSIISAVGKRGKRAVRYSAFPVAVIALLCGSFAAYHIQEYGNLECAPSFKADTAGVAWSLACELDDSATSAPVYKTNTCDKETCEAFGYGFFEMIDAQVQDVYYYDREIWFAKHSSPAHFLVVSLLDGSYTYSHPIDDDVWAETNRETIENALEAFGIEIPDGAAFTYEGSGWHAFTMERVLNGDAMLDGSVRCRYTENGAIGKIENDLISYDFYKEEDIITAVEAYERLKRGGFSGGDVFESYSPCEVRVLSCSFEYEVDSKGFYRPVYVFYLVSTDEAFEEYVKVPAMT